MLTDDSRSGPAVPAAAGSQEPMMEHSEAAAARSRDVPLDEARLRQQAIGVKLRQMFDEVVSEPVPDDFLEILRRADERRSGK